MISNLPFTQLNRWGSLPAINPLWMLTVVSLTVELASFHFNH